MSEGGEPRLQPYIHCRLYTLHHSEGLNSLDEILNALHWSYSGILQRLVREITEVANLHIKSQDRSLPQQLYHADARLEPVNQSISYLESADHLNANVLPIKTTTSWNSDQDSDVNLPWESENWDDERDPQIANQHAVGSGTLPSSYHPVDCLSLMSRTGDIDSRPELAAAGLGKKTIIDENKNPELTSAADFPHTVGFTNMKIMEQTSAESEDANFKMRYTPPEWDDKPVMGGRKLLVRNISFKVDQHQLWEFFKQFGAVKFCELMKGKDGRSRGIAYVTFRNAEDAKNVLSVPDEELYIQDRQMTVCYATRKKRAGHHQAVEDDSNQVLDMESNTAEFPSRTYDETDYTGHILSLNSDVMVNIFSRLSLRNLIRMRQVCQRWRQAASLTMQYSRRLDLTDLAALFQGFKVMDEPSMMCLLRQFAGGPDQTSSLREINLSQSSRFLTNDTLHTIARTCPNLTSLDASGMSITNNGLTMLSGKCLHLKVLKLRKCNKIGEDGLWWIFHRCKNLQVVDLEDIKRLKGKCLHVLGHQLESLNLQGCSKLQSSGLRKIAKQCPSLRQIDISRCTTIAGDGVIALTQGCSKLTSVNLSELNSNAVTASDLVGLGRLGNLEELYLTWLKSTNDLVLSSISHGCTKLRVLDITGAGLVSDMGLNNIGMCMNLQKLNISYLQVTDYGLDSIFLVGSLTSLIARGCNSITGGGFMMAVDLCPQLTLLDMSGCFQVYTDDFESMLIARETINPVDVLTIFIGSTFIDPSVLEIPPFVHVEEIDLCEYHNITRDLVLRTDFSSDEEDGDGNGGQGRLIDNEMGGEAAAAAYDDDDVDDEGVDGFLDNDDPLEMERFDFS